MEEKIRPLIESVIDDLGLDLVKVSFQGGSRKVLEILIIENGILFLFRTKF
jgi:ribosome maturation factor RimP